MKKTKQILALLGAILLAGLFVGTLVLAIVGSEHTFDLMMAAFVACFAVPFTIWLFERMRRHRNGED